MSQNNGVVGLNLNPKTNKQIKHERKMKLTRKSVLNMLAVMEASQSDAGPSNSANNIPVTPESPTNAQEFLSSGRTGRRNALPDILGQHALVTSSDLPSKLQGLSTNDKSSEDKRHQPGTSKS
ncbi:uncharacterized protein isoform X2 [Leptinotarsa decemlineata]|uniref:uncharacterized protein isoform X2 n=1 Tax=Leptinotarsa decemlineata TaxID=7539 RepID=UPI003D308DE4